MIKKIFFLIKKKSRENGAEGSGVNHWGTTMASEGQRENQNG